MTKKELLNSNIKNDLLLQVVNAALRAGAAIMKVYNSYCEGKVDKAKSEYMVEANLVANNIVKENLGASRIPIFSEEGRKMEYDERRSWEIFWLVDPLDGTLEFLNKSNEFTVNIALMYHGEAAISVVYVPYLKRLYYALSENGSFLCDSIEANEETAIEYEQLMKLGSQLPLVKHPRKQQRVMLSRSHTTPETLEMVEALKLEHPNLITMEQGSSYKFCILAEGESDCYIRTSTTYEWDTAAGELILQEAGGVTMPIENEHESLSYNKENPENPWFMCYSKVSQIKNVPQIKQTPNK